MLNRLYTVVWLFLLAWLLLQFVLQPAGPRATYFVAFFVALAFRFVVRLPSGLPRVDRDL
jgi:hypothetical protein